MSISTLFPTFKTTHGIDSRTRYPLKKWVSETRIEPLDPTRQLSWHCRGSETHFRGGHSSHWFKIMLPVTEPFNEEHDSLSRVVMNFMTIGNAELCGMEIYDGPAMLWKTGDCRLQGNNRYSIGPENSWHFDPTLIINHDLFLTIGVTFGTPDIRVPEFIFYGARVLFECTDSFINDSNDLMNGDIILQDALSAG